MASGLVTLFLSRPSTQPAPRRSPPRPASSRRRSRSVRTRRNYSIVPKNSIVALEGWAGHKVSSARFRAQREENMDAVSRRRFLSLTCATGTLLLDPAWRLAGAVTPVADPLARLVAGNKRFVASKLTHPNQAAQRRTAVAKGQRPF